MTLSNVCFSPSAPALALLLANLLVSSWDLFFLACQLPSAARSQNSPMSISGTHLIQSDLAAQDAIQTHLSFPEIRWQPKSPEASWACGERTTVSFVCTYQFWTRFSLTKWRAAVLTGKVYFLGCWKFFSQNVWLYRPLEHVKTALLNTSDEALSLWSSIFFVGPSNESITSSENYAFGMI